MTTHHPTRISTHRASDSAESIHLLQAGATRTVPDERESAISMATVLLRDVLKMDSPRLIDLSNDLRLRVEEDERKEFEVLQRRSGLKSSTDRVSDDDKVGGNVSPVLNTVTRRFADMMGSAKSFMNDQRSEDLAPFEFLSKGPVPKGVEAFEEGTIDERGVLVCALPPKASKKVESPVPVEDATKVEDLGVLVCAVPAKGIRVTEEKKEN
jgi:hypothetical protein